MPLAAYILWRVCGAHTHSHRKLGWVRTQYNMWVTLCQISEQEHTHSRWEDYAHLSRITVAGRASPSCPWHMPRWQRAWSRLARSRIQRTSISVTVSPQQVPLHGSPPLVSPGSIVPHPQWARHDGLQEPLQRVSLGSHSLTLRVGWTCPPGHWTETEVARTGGVAQDAW